MGENSRFQFQTRRGSSTPHIQNISGTISDWRGEGKYPDCFYFKRIVPSGWQFGKLKCQATLKFRYQKRQLRHSAWTHLSTAEL